MKKIVICIAVVGFAALTSCKKDYVCTYASDNSIAEYNKINKPAANVTQKSCELGGGTWSVK